MTSQQPSRFLLRWNAAGGAVEERPLPVGEVTLGRSSECEVTLDDAMISRRHALLRIGPDAAVIEDLGSRNGTFVNGERISSADLRAGDEIGIGGLTIKVAGLAADETIVAEPGGEEATIIIEREAPPPPTQRAGAVVTEDVLARPIVTERELVASGIEVKVVDYATLGGGLGSFVFIDFLRNAGVRAEDIAVVGPEERPHARYERLCRNSQIPRHERLRSNSDSCPDNVWGFPGYAVREAWRELLRGNAALAGQVLWGIFGEPTLSQTYTPRSGDVFASIEKEVERIGWKSMLRPGRIRAIRKSDEGRLLAVVSESDDQRRKHSVVSARFLHLAIGYPAIQLLPDLAEFREKHGDRTRVLNAYESHDHMYDQLRKKEGTVLLRGRGIVASRIIQRLWEERRKGAKINVVHLHRSNLTEGHRYGLGRRAVDAQFEFQPFNWPKACWGGELRGVLEAAPGDKRKQLLDTWGGTTTADRRDWQRMVREGLREGWYRSEFGVVRDVTPGDDGRILTHISSSLAGGGTLEIAADFVLDCTGLVASADRSPLIADLLKTYNLPLNKAGRLQVSNDFEIEGMRHAQSRMFASGAITFGGPYAAVDSFLGLQYTALRAMDAIYSYRPPGLRRLNGPYSFLQWLKWARGAPP